MKPVQVLIVEDEIIIAKDIELTLLDLGYEVSAIVVAGEEAIQAAATLRPDIILMDIKLQGHIDGIEAAKRIYSQWYIPVIYLTAHADTATVQRAKVSCPYGFVIKPFDERELYTSIEIALHKRQCQAQERRLQETQRLESLGVLASGVAHNFNNMLTAIRGNVELALLDLPPDSSIRDSLEQADKATERAANLARQILAYAGKGRYVLERVALNDVIVEAANVLTSTIGKSTRLHYSLAPDIPPIAADAGQLRLIVMNLVLNAAEAIGATDGVISLTTSLLQADHELLATFYLGDQLPEGEYLALEVADSGCGMNSATQAKIFEPFFTTKTSGPGLGLAAVFGIVGAYHGAIKAESEVGRGSIFTILLPTAETV
jgi:signal transduction histidine kinase